MRGYDLAIAGNGLLPAVLALHLRRGYPGLRILLLAGDAQIPGRGLELVMPARLPPTVRDTLAPCCVAQWQAFFMAPPHGSIAKIREAVIAVDPIQLWVDLVDAFGSAALVAGCRDLRWTDGRLAWPGRSEPVGDFIDLRGLADVAAMTDVVEGPGLGALELPALSDFSAPDAPWSCLLHLPIGRGRVAARRLFRGTAGWIPADISGLPGGDNYQLLHAAGAGLR
ncbi:MAG: hypothetical protein RIQ99_1548 [Pseudomonadota bacterium]